MIRTFMKSSALIVLCWIFAAESAVAQGINWDMNGAQEVSSPLGSLPLQDQQGIVKQLNMKPSELLAMRVNTATGGHIFLVQGIYRIGGICGANNCEFWILSNDYRILLEKVTQKFKLQASTHNGLPDIVTSMHGSAFNSGLSYWRFQGKHYVRIACADAEYGDADGNYFKNPHISLYPCGTGG